ncbi:MAG: hypothetical protein WC384_05700 [Prolixibacteraceae bacterium]
MKKRISLLLITLLFAFSGQKSWSAQVKISGKALDYANQSIDLNIYHDFISEDEIKLGTIKFNSSGEFNLTIELAETNLAFADFDGYHGMIYLEPGKYYKIIFPPKRIQTDAQKRNPFAKPEFVWFGISNPEKDELNVRIGKFEEAYSIYENKYFDQIFANRNASLVDTVKQKLDQEFPKTSSIFFEAHKTFRKADLEFALHQGKGAGFMEAYFSKTKPEYNLAAYSNLFNQVFMNYFNNLVNNPKSQKIRNFIDSSNLVKLDDYFQKELHFNKELSHLVLLKSLKDGYYNKEFSKASILKMFGQIKSPEWSRYEQETAQIIRKSLTWLTRGTNPPAINLTSLSGKKVNFSDYPNTYIYLHFTDPKNSICRQHLDVLKTVASHYTGKLVIINIIPESSGFKNESEWPGIFATTNSNYKEIYKVKTYPISFLIGKDGKLLLSPAPNPIDGLDRQMGQILKSDYFREQQKKNSPAVK